MDESGRSRRGALLGAEAALACALVLAPLALGTVHLWAIAVVAALAGIAALAAALARPRRVPWPVMAAAALAAYTGLQAIPLPRLLLELLSPHAVELLDFSLGAPIASHALSLDPPATAREFARLLTYTFALFAASRLSSDERVARRLVHAVAALSVLQCLLIVGHKVVATSSIYGVFPTTQYNMVLGSFGNANHLAGYFTLGIPLLLELGISAEETGDRVAWLVAGGVSCVMVLLTTSRSGVLGLAAALLVLAITLRARLREVRGPLVALGGGLGAIALVVLALDGGRLLGKMSSLAHPSALWSDVKVRAWRDVPALIHDYFAAGIGRGAFETVFPSYKRVPEQLTFTHVENAPLQILADFGGLVGTALMVAWVAALVIAVRREQKGAREDRALRLGAAAALVGITVHELGDFALDISSAVGLTAAVLFGLLWSARRSHGGEGERGRSEPSQRGPRRELRVGAVAVALVAGGGAIAYAVQGDIARDLAAVQSAAAEPGADIEQLAREAIARHPGEPWLPFMAGLDRLHHRKPAAALPYLNRALLLDPTAWRPHQALAEALLALGKRGQGLLEYRLAYEGSGFLDAVAAPLVAHAEIPLPEIYDRFVGADARALAAFAAFLDRAQRNDAAADAAKRLLAARPDSEPAHRLLARVEVRRRHFAAALTEARALPRDDAESLLIQVQSLDGLGRGAEADALLSVADAMGASSPLEASTGMLLADRAIARKHPAAALAALDRIAQDTLGPEELARILLLRSRVHEADGHTREAILEAERAARLNPSEPTWLALGATYERVGLMREALLVYRGAIRSTPKPSDELRARLQRIERPLGVPTLDGAGSSPAQPSVLDEVGGEGEAGEGAGGEGGEGRGE